MCTEETNQTYLSCEDQLWVENHVRPFSIVSSDTYSSLLEATCQGGYVVHFTCMITKWALCNCLMKKTDLVDAFREFCIWTRDMKRWSARTPNQCMCTEPSSSIAKILTYTSSPYTPYLKAMSDQTERYFGVVTNMSRDVLEILKVDDAYWSLAAHCAIYLKNRLPSSALSTERHITWSSDAARIARIYAFCAHEYIHIPPS